MFAGGKVPARYDDHVKKWGIVIRLFLLSVNRENGTLMHLPTSGGLLNQPKKTMDVFLFLQEIFIRKMNEKIKKETPKGRKR